MAYLGNQSMKRGHNIKGLMPQLKSIIQVEKAALLHPI